MSGIAYQVLGYAQAMERFSLTDLPRPQVDEIRVVHAAVTLESFCLDEPAFEELAEDDMGELFAGAWVFLDGLTVRDALTNVEPGVVLVVRGTLHVGRGLLVGVASRLWGDLVVDRVLVTDDAGSMRVEGRAKAPVVLVTNGHDTTFAGGLEGERFDDPEEAAARFDSACVVEGEVDVGALWERAATDAPLLLPRDPTPPPAHVIEDRSFRASRALVDRWAAGGLVVFEEGTDLDEFAELLAKSLEELAGRPDTAEALGEWLLDRSEVADVLASDADLVNVPSILSSVPSRRASRREKG